MKIGQYCQRQRCRHVKLEQFFRLSRRAGLSAIAGLSCSFDFELYVMSSTLSLLHCMSVCAVVANLTCDKH